jgi:hypothetical protein
MAKPSVSVQIVLSEDISTVKSIPKSIIRHCGDKILGYLEVMTFRTFEFDILISFEGFIYSLIIDRLHVTKVKPRLRANLDWFWFRK